MSELTLVIGNKNYSSWSLRPWLLLTRAGISFSEVRIPLYTAESRDRILHYSPSGRVPVLIDGAVTIWESLAICEYMAERFPEANAWPRDAHTRALARCVATEMHSGFSALRAELPMNCRGRRTGVVPSVTAQADIDRIVDIWRTCRERFASAGPWLFGAFTIADAMFAPVALRFWTYGVRLPDAAERYVAEVLQDRAIRDWQQAARAETEIIPGVEFGAPISQDPA